MSSDRTASPSADHRITRDLANSFSFPALGQTAEVIRSTRGKALLLLLLCRSLLFEEKEEEDAAGAGNQLPSFGQREILEFRPSDGKSVWKATTRSGECQISGSSRPAHRPPAGSLLRRTVRTRPSPGQRRTGRSVADKEHKRLKSDPSVCFWCVPFHKRLLRNRVSAQQARERKKAYLNDLEAKMKDLEARNSELEERMSTLQNENNMLRQILDSEGGIQEVEIKILGLHRRSPSRKILKNTTVGRRGSGSNANGEGR
ncbi:hypothetical protein MUK42_03330 [Musa troglodytarum]|uniref:Transcription factor HY5 n=1 Tax=Musa troglodytarum TaxID=320322 RepID=A0A9E7HT63_9LILI|nr:hypothetical protein MUK42_03330 [Musa troglodytarum]